MSPVISLMARRTAAPLPMFRGWLKMRISGCRAASRCAISQVASVEPSSTRTISRTKPSGNGTASTRSAHRRSVASSLYAAMSKDNLLKRRGLEFIGQADADSATAGRCIQPALLILAFPGRISGGCVGGGTGARKLNKRGHKPTNGTLMNAPETRIESGRFRLKRGTWVAAPPRRNIRARRFGRHVPGSALSAMLPTRSRPASGRK